MIIYLCKIKIEVYYSLFNLIMSEKKFNNADSFAMSFDEEWEKLECNDTNLKIKKTIEKLSDHPFVINNPQMAINVANFRIHLLKKLK